jgi:hypothetical protein
VEIHHDKIPILILNKDGIVIDIVKVSQKHFKFIIMNNLLYLVAVILILGWAIGVFAYSATGLIHVLLVIAVIAIILRLISGRNPL